MNPTRSVILKDILWYFIGNIAPLMVGLIKSPIYTRIFSTEDFGAYSLVFPAFGYFSIICYSWIINCVWRFYYKYKEGKGLNVLYSNLLFFYIAFSFVILLISSIWFSLADNILIKRLIFLCFLQYFTSEVLTLFFVRPRLEGKVFSYNLIQTVRAFGSFGLLLLFTFVFDFGIESFLISNIILNILLILIIVIPDYFKLHLSPLLINKSDLKIFFEYGKIGLVISLCSALLISSDRFVIEFFTGLNEVGIYTQNYNIAQMSIAMLIQVYWATLNPHLLPILEHKPVNMQKYIYEYFKIFFFCFLPITLYFILYAKDIAFIMLGENFRVGYTVIFWAALAEFIAGLYFLSVSRLKFENKFRVLSATYIMAVILNIGLNILFIPTLGYKSAAITTVIANIFLFLVFSYKDDTQYFSILGKSREFKYCIILLGIQVTIHLFSVNYSFPQYYYIIEGITFIAAYIAIALKYKWINFDSISLQTEEK